VVIFEQQDTGVDVQSGWIVKIQFVARGFHRRACGEGRYYALQLLNVGIDERRGEPGDSGKLWGGVLLLLRGILGGEGSLRWEGGWHDWAEVVVRRHRRNRLLLVLLLFLLKLHRSHTSNRLLPFNAFLFACLEHLFVFNSQLAALNIEPIQRRYHRISVARGPKIGERKATELTGLVEVVVERVGSWDRQRSLR